MAFFYAPSLLLADGYSLRIDCISVYIFSLSFAAEQ